MPILTDLGQQVVSVHSHSESAQLQQANLVSLGYPSAYVVPTSKNYQVKLSYADWVRFIK